MSAASGGVLTSFFAHSTADPSRVDWQTLPSHSLAVGDLAAEFAAIFAGGELARVLGRLHDLGKYTQEFQLSDQGRKALLHRRSLSAEVVPTEIALGGAIRILFLP